MQMGQPVDSRLLDRHEIDYGGDAAPDYGTNAWPGLCQGPLLAGMIPQCTGNNPMAWAVMHTHVLQT